MRLAGDWGGLVRQPRCRRSLLLVMLSMAAVVWVRLLPLERTEPALRYRGEDNRTHVYLGDFDSYLWLRMARDRLRTGPDCDTGSGGACRDNHPSVPIVAPMEYQGSFHDAAIAWLHRFVTLWVPGYPLPATSFLIPVIVGALGVLPAFGIGRRLAGPAGGCAAALLSALHPVVLQRSIGSDNDVWNVVLPLFLMCAGIEALLTRSRARAMVLAAFAGAIAALHASIWSGWQVTFAVMLAASLAAMGRRTLVAALHRRNPLRDPSTGRAVLVVVTLVAACAIVGGFLGSLVGAPETLRSQLSNPPPAPQSSLAPTVVWPDVFSTVGELAPTSMSGARRSIGDALLSVGLFGGVILMFPYQRWRWWRWGILLVAAGLIAYALTRVGWERPSLMGLLALPIIVAWALSIGNAGKEEDSHAIDAGLVVAIWQLATVYFACHVLRFTMVAVAPLAIGVASVVGRAYDALSRRLERLAARPRAFAQAALAGTLGLLCFAPIRQGAVVARSYTPAIDSAWWDTLTATRDSTPPDTIVNTFWNYGYWAQYVTERRVIANGGSLLTHIPYWVARALYTSDEREAVGLLRMLDCGSDAMPSVKVNPRAYSKLVTYGVDPGFAPTLLSELAKRDRDAARSLLQARSLPEGAIADVLNSTHCTPPPAVLALSSQLGQTPWTYLGSWNFAETDLRGPLADRSEAEQIEALTHRYELSAGAAQALRLRERSTSWPTPQPSEYITEHWAPCTAQDEPGIFLCPIDRELRDGLHLESVLVRTDAPAESRMRLLNRFPPAAGSKNLDGRPALVLIASESGLSTTSANPAAPAEVPLFGWLALLFDAVHQRVLVGSPAILQSTFTQLMYLDGRYSSHFRRVQDHVGFADNRVCAFTIDWSR